MTAQLVFGSFNGRVMHWLEKFPVTVPMETPVVLVHERYDLTPEQATLSLHQLKELVAIGAIK